jgi:hypothetical protein
MYIIMSNSIGTGFSSTANGKSGFTSGGLGGFEILIPGLGRNIYVNNNPSLGPLLGGGFKGLMPQPLIIHDNSNDFSQTRFALREAWNTSSLSGSSNPKRIVTPFRAVNNAGDLLSRQNYSCGGTCQTYQSRPGLHGLRQRFGAVSDSCQADVFWSPAQIDPKVPASACNTKYVYDSSDYIRFLKNQAVNKNYNDRSFGGNDSSAQQSKWRSVRRY